MLPQHDPDDAGAENHEGLGYPAEAPEQEAGLLPQSPGRQVHQRASTQDHDRAGDAPSPPR